ncbi:MAG: TonB-dependent receptor, partial [Marinilabiliales bacterium]|nr:TonB-dependent receptor [Marinilabiliales bacterium]
MRLLKRYFAVSLLLLFAYPLAAQYHLSGTVVNSSGESLPGATVRIALGNKVQATDAKGNFHFENLPSPAVSLVVSFIGYQTSTTEVKLNKGSNQLRVTLANTAYLTEDVIVSATRAGSKTPVAYTNLDISSRTEKMMGQDLPFLLSMTPSLITTSDAGTGIGYTNFRIRGSDANRINMTVNGIPLNDAESHSVYFVDLPDFASSTENVQVQRGVGSSTNGAGAFGGTVNIQTSNLSSRPYASWSSAAGSFGTLKNTVSVGSGRLDDHFIVEARLSKISSDGYVDRAFSNLHSFFLTGGYITDRTLLKAIVFSGTERTYQAWNGVPSSLLNTDRTYNPSGIIYGPKGEVSYYDNETDNYQQDHYQLHYTRQISRKMSANLSLHYTYGRGYYEEYRQNQSYADYLM